MTSPTFFSVASSSLSQHHRLPPLSLINVPSVEHSSSYAFPVRSQGVGVGLPIRRTRRRMMTASPVGASDSTAVVEDQEAASPSAAASLSSEEEEKAAATRIGARVRVKVPLKVYHVPRVPEMDLTGVEGVMKQYVGVWKGKHISANLPYKVEFVREIEGRGPVKFFAHLKEDEFEYLD